MNDLLESFKDEKAKLIRYMKAVNQTWVREPNKRTFDLTTPLIKSFVE